MNTRRFLVAVCVIVFAASALLLGPPARGLSWTQTTEADFLAGDRTNLDVRPTGELVLSHVSEAWSREGVILDLGAPGSADSVYARMPFLMRDGAMYKMWYSGYDGGRNRILYAESPDGVTWTRFGVVIDAQQPPWNFDSVAFPDVVKESGIYKMWFHGGFWTNPLSGNNYYAESSDGITWNILGVALGTGPVGTWDDTQVGSPNVYRDPTGRYWMFYQGWDGTAGGLNERIGVASSTNGQTFTRTGIDPVITLGPTGSWDSRFLAAPFVVPGNPWRMWYTGSAGATQQIGLATALGPYNWTKSPGNPDLVVGPPTAWDDAHVAAGAIFVDGLETYMYYTGGDGSNYRIGRARLAPGYAASGSFESQILDAGYPGTLWRVLYANATVNLFSFVTVQTRSGDTASPDASWSSWSAPASPGPSGITSPRGRYLQVRVTMSTASLAYTPVFTDFTVTYDLNTAASPTPVSPVGGTWVNTAGLRTQWAHADPEGDPQGRLHVQVSDRSDFATVAADSGSVVSASSAWDSPPLADGGWYWRVQTADAYGEWSPYSAAAFARIDTVPPATSATFSLTPGYVAGIPQLDGSNRILLSGADDGSGVTQIAYSINGGPSAVYTGPFLPSAHGLATLRFWATDGAGNTEPPNAIDILLDDPPTAFPASPVNGAWTNASSVTVGWTYSDPDGDAPSAYEVQLADNPAFLPVRYSSGTVSGSPTAHTFIGVADGTYLWRVRAADALSVWSPFSGSRTVSVDTRAPAVTLAFDAILGAPDGRTWIAPGTRMTLTATDSGSGVGSIHYAVDGVDTLYTGPVPLAPAHGVHTLESWAIDLAGNRGPTESIEILLDGPPAAAIVSPGSASWVTAAPTFRWQPSDPDGDTIHAFELQVSPDPGFSSISASSGVVDSPGSTTWQGPALADGSYYWRIRVRDEFGVWSGWSASSQFGVDATAPVTTARHGGSPIPKGGYTMAPGERVALEATDAGSGIARIEFSLDGGTWTTYAAPIVFEATGPHLLAFRATDVAGNVEQAQMLVIEVAYPFNWTPVIAMIWALVLALVGGLVARRTGSGSTPSRGVVWALVAGPATAVEALIAVFSLVTGELAMPPWTGGGLVSVVSVGAAGIASCLIGARALASRAGLPA